MTVDELRKLHADIWKVVEDHSRVCHRPYKKIRWGRESRCLTYEEMFDVLKSVEDLGLVATLGNACMGFGISITLWESPPVPQTKPQLVIRVTSDHIREGARFEDGWQLFYPVAATKNNQRLMEWCGFEPLKDKHYYDY